ncbi:unnamed protein product [Pieris macdunnoughi]|uniref:G-protein coupled receptors family 2 profile 2 domain-containing protein n=1 Tax=Pieris macdunnoughi TaxID=345717 RepID=A0A821WX89_9NEOP|nr:unnamed protein product [Pieris macdunnoughi]
MIRLTVSILFLIYPLSRASIDSNDINRYTYNCTHKDGECAKQKVNVDFELCASKVCIYKCCPRDQVVLYSECVQAKAGNLSDVDVYDYYLNKAKRKFNEIFHVITNKYANRVFAESAYLAIFIGGDVYLEESGSLYVEMPNQYRRWIQITNKDFCIDYSMTENDTLSDSPQFFVNYQAEPPRQKQSTIYVVALGISSVFLFLVLLIYILLPEAQNLVGKIRMCYVSSYIGYFVSVAVVLDGSHSETTCKILSFIAYFSIIATCCWMNIMSYDIWSTFRTRGSTKFSGSSERRRIEKRKFRRYCCYGWGIPLSMAAGLMIINSLDLSGLPWFITPQIPTWGCFLIDGQQFVYMYIPMMILVGGNCLLFLLTACSIWESMRGNEVLGPAATKRQQQRFKICVRLSVTMGVSWIWEVISFLVPAADEFALYLDLYNGCIGFLIFLIFVCNRRKLAHLKARFQSWRHPKSFNQNTSNDSQAVAMKRLDNSLSTVEF